MRVVTTFTGRNPPLVGRASARYTASAQEESANIETNTVHYAKRHSRS